MRPQAFQDDVRRDLEKDIGHEEDGQGGVEVVALELEILLQAIDSGVTNVNATHVNNLSVSSTEVMTMTMATTRSCGLPVQEGHQVQQAKHRQQPPIDLPHQSTLGGVRRTSDSDVVGLDIVRAVIGAGMDAVNIRLLRARRGDRKCSGCCVCRSC